MGLRLGPNGRLFFSTLSDPKQWKSRKKLSQQIEFPNVWTRTRSKYLKKCASPHLWKFCTLDLDFARSQTRNFKTRYKQELFNKSEQKETSLTTRALTEDVIVSILRNGCCGQQPRGGEGRPKRYKKKENPTDSSRDDEEERPHRDFTHESSEGLFTHQNFINETQPWHTQADLHRCSVTPLGNFLNCEKKCNGIVFVNHSLFLAKPPAFGWMNGPARWAR